MVGSICRLRGVRRLVDGDLLDVSRGTDGEARTPIALSSSAPIAEPTTDLNLSARPAIKATSEAAAAPTDGDPLGPPQVVEAEASTVGPNTADPSHPSTAHPGEWATETELKRERLVARVVAEAMLKPLRLPVWKVRVDCLDMVAGRGWRGELLMWVCVEGDGGDRAAGTPCPLGFYGPLGGAGGAQAGL